MNPILAPVLGGIVNTVGQVIDDLVTTDKERLDAEIELRKLGIEEKRIEADLAKGQIEVNKEGAKHESTFVAGARPFIMWVCGFAFAYVAILEPLLRFASKVWFGYAGEFPSIDTDLTLQVLFGILGLGAYRTAEKFKGVAR